MIAKLKKGAKIFAPPGTLRFKVVKRLARILRLIPNSSPDIKYAEWAERTEPFIWSDYKELSFKPKISIVVPVYNSPAKYLMPMVFSVVNQQFYENWELVLVNASDKKKSIELTRSCADIDSRIKIVEVKENKGIAGNTNAGIKNASGEYIGLLDHDDLLAPHALYEVASVLQVEASKRPQLIYSDEDKITENGEHRYDVHFKPDWSPELLRNVNYLNHLTVIDKGLLNKAGNYRAGFDGAQDYDLYLRLVDAGAKVKHIPRILYHWRAAHSSTAQNFASKKQAVLSSGVRALDEHLARNNLDGKASFVEKQPGFYKVTYSPKDSKAALLILPTKNEEQYSYLLTHLGEALRKTTLKTDAFVYKNSASLGTDNPNVKMHTIDTDKQSEFVGEALGKTSAKVLIIINSAVIPRSADWVEQLAGILIQNKHLGAIAPVLLEPKNKIICDAGFVKHDGIAIGLFQGMALGAHTYFGNTLWTRNVDYLSGRIVALRREVFETYVNDPAFYERDNLFDADPYKRMLEDGLRVAVYPQIQMDYYGELTPAQYKAPFFNPSLSVVRYEPGLAKNINVPPEVEA